MDETLMTTKTMVSTAPRHEVSHDTDGNLLLREHGPFVVARTTNDSSRRTASEVVSDRIDESEIPGWVNRRFSSLATVPPVLPVRRGLSPRTTVRVPLTSAGEPCVSDQVYLALARSGYPLQHVRCWCDDQTLTLSGYVTRYYYMQVAVEVAMALANGRRIGVSIEVVPAPLPNLTAD